MFSFKDMGDQQVFAIVADDGETVCCQAACLYYFFSCKLGMAAGNGNTGMRIDMGCLADQAALLPACFCGYSAGVDDDNIGLFHCSRSCQAGIFKTVCYRG
jgi:hypothetical protein